MSLMALVDGEISGPDRAQLEEHLSHCAYCNEEYNDILRMNEATCEAFALAAPAPASISWDTYYRGVCRKMESRASWAAWSIVSLLLVVAGALMIFGCQGAPLAMLAGTIALGAGAALIVISYYCNCCGK